ncbi:MAG: flagellar hook-basal body protein [Desulfitobacteriaceae bacterium]
MIRGLYSSAAGMLVTQKQTETVGENLDNVRNPGYREEQNIVTAFPTVLLDRMSSTENGSEKVPIGTMGTGVIADRVTMKISSGLVEETNQPTDVALVSQGFFIVQTLAGERYTRNGHFELDETNRLRTTAGNLVLGENGEIGPLSPDFKIEYDGTIKDNGQIVDRLRIVDIPGSALQREGKTTLYNTTQTPVPVARDSIQMRQGAIEESNVDVDTQMVKMVVAMRAYEANQRVIQIQDQTLEKAVNEVGRV